MSRSPSVYSDVVDVVGVRTEQVDGARPEMARRPDQLLGVPGGEQPPPPLESRTPGPPGFRRTAGSRVADDTVGGAMTSR